MAVAQASFLRERNYWAVAITHFFVDILNSGRTLLVALLAVSLELSNAQVGIALLLYNVGNSLSQPLFGLLADRIGPRLLVVGGMGWMIAFYGFASAAGDWPALIALTIAGIGSGAFHPTGTMVASKISLTHRTRATALFFMAGQFGLFSGPILAGILLDQFGRPGYLALPAASFIAFASSWRWLVNKKQDGQKETTTVPRIGSQQKAPSNHIRRAVLLAIIISSGSTVSIAAINFAPKLFTELGKSPGYVGVLGGLLMMGSAFGGLVGGTLADRIGGRPVILFAVLATMAPIYYYIPVEGIGRFILLLLAGFFGGMPHSILIIWVQSLLPERRALASGLALGFMFFSGSVGSTVIGVVADNVGLAQALQWTAFIPILAAAATLLLPKQPADAAQR